MKKFYGLSINNRLFMEELKKRLKLSGIYYEASECYQGYHIEILATKEQADIINEWLIVNSI